MTAQTNSPDSFTFTWYAKEPDPNRQAELWAYPDGDFQKGVLLGRAAGGGSAESQGQSQMNNIPANIPLYDLYLFSTSKTNQDDKRFIDRTVVPLKH